MTTTEFSLLTGAAEEYAELIGESRLGTRRWPPARLLHEVTKHEPSLHDAMAAVVCVLADCHFGDDNYIAEGILKGFTYPDLAEAANRHEARNPDPDDVVPVAATDAA